MVMGRWFRGAHAARVRARAARSRELFFVWALSFASIVPEVRFGEPPKPAREPRALPGLQQLIWINVDGHDDVFGEGQFVESFADEAAQAHDGFAADQNVETELAL